MSSPDTYAVLRDVLMDTKWMCNFYAHDYPLEEHGEVAVRGTGSDGTTVEWLFECHFPRRVPDGAPGPEGLAGYATVEPAGLPDVTPGTELSRAMQSGHVELAQVVGWTYSLCTGWVRGTAIAACREWAWSWIVQRMVWDAEALDRVMCIVRALQEQEVRDEFGPAEDGAMSPDV